MDAEARRAKSTIGTIWCPPRLPIPAPAGAGQPGPVRFRAVLLTALALGLLGQAARAEVPFQEALGIYAHTNPDHRNLSPIWGMIALKGHILSRIRQFGPYAATPHPRYPRHWLADRRACPQDGASALVQHLFRPGSATTVAPMEAREDPIGQIAREVRANREQGTREGALRRIRS